MKRKFFSLFAAIVFVAALFTLPASAAIVQDIPEADQIGKVLVCEYTREAGVSSDFSVNLLFRAENTSNSSDVKWPTYINVKQTEITCSDNSASWAGTLNKKLCDLDANTRYEIVVLLDNTVNVSDKCMYRVYVNGVCVTKNQWTSPKDVVESAAGYANSTMKWTKIDYSCPFAFVGALDSIDKFDEDAYKAFITGSSDSAVAITSSDSGFDGFNIIIDGSNGSKTVSELKNSLTLSDGADIVFTRGGSELGQDESLQTGDKAVVSSSNFRVENTYAVTVKDIEITSDVYTIDIFTSSIKGILKYTKLEQILKNIKTAEGYAIDGIYNGDVKVSTNAFVENGYTLKLTNGSTYSLTLKESSESTRTGQWVDVNLKETFNWPRASKTNNKMLFEFTLPKTLPDGISDVVLYPRSDDNKLNNFYFLYTGTQCCIANNYSANYIDVINKIIGDETSIDFKLIADLESKSIVLYANGKFVAAANEDIFGRYFKDNQRETGTYDTIYMNYVPNKLTCTYIENTENCEKDISADKYDVLTVSEKDGALSASTLAYSNGMMIFASYDETSGRLLNVKCVDTQERTACTAELEAPKNTGKVKVFLWSDKLVPKAVYEK